MFIIYSYILFWSLFFVFLFSFVRLLFFLHILDPFFGIADLLNVLFSFFQIFAILFFDVFCKFPSIFKFIYLFFSFLHLIFTFLSPYLSAFICHFLPFHHLCFSFIFHFFVTPFSISFTLAYYSTFNSSISSSFLTFI